MQLPLKYSYTSFRLLRSVTLNDAQPNALYPREEEKESFENHLP